VNKPLYRYPGVFTIIMLFITACSAQSIPVQTQTEEPALYETVLDKSLTDKAVADFITRNSCSSTNEFELCQDAGMAFWLDTNQIIKTVYMYAGNADGFKQYRGKLPFGLSFYDPMWKVEDKLKDPSADEKLHSAWKAGLPDQGDSPDHVHYWAVYKRLGLTVIYNSASADKDAYIYAVLVSA
jgi:hypothetical protein